MRGGKGEGRSPMEIRESLCSGSRVGLLSGSSSVGVSEIFPHEGERDGFVWAETERVGGAGFGTTPRCPGVVSLATRVSVADWASERSGAIVDGESVGDVVELLGVGHIVRAIETVNGRIERGGGSASGVGPFRG